MAAVAAAADRSISDDWSNRVIAVDEKDGGAEMGRSDDAANAGIRREPELPQHEEVGQPEPSAKNEMDMLDDEPDESAAKTRILRFEGRTLARRAAMDRGSGTDM
jgi:type IV secretion system protein VirD4